MPGIVQIVNRKEIGKAAAALGARGGKAKTDAKKRASAKNGKLGGRPVRTLDVDGVEVHADAEPIGGAFRARTPAAAQWLRRHGYVSSWPERPVTWRRR